MSEENAALACLAAAHEKLVDLVPKIGPASPAAAELRACISKVAAVANYVESKIEAIETAVKSEDQ